MPTWPPPKSEDAMMRSAARGCAVVIMLIGAAVFLAVAVWAWRVALA